VNEDLPISTRAIQMTKEILFERAISDAG